MPVYAGTAVSGATTLRSGGGLTGDGVDDAEFDAPQARPFMRCVRLALLDIDPDAVGTISKIVGLTNFAKRHIPKVDISDLWYDAPRPGPAVAFAWVA